MIQRILYQLYQKRKQKKHLAFLKKSCRWGENLCTSKIYGNYLEQLMNIKINNLSNDPDKFIIGNNCNISCKATLNEHGSVIIGDYVFMNFVTMRIDYNLKVGTHCLFGPNVVLWDTDNHPISASERHKQAEQIALNFPLQMSYHSKGGSITIEDDVWIGMDALILGGVTIGKGAIVAARSVVTKNIEPYTIVGGIPAKKIGTVPI